MARTGMALMGTVPTATTHAPRSGLRRTRMTMRADQASTGRLVRVVPAVVLEHEPDHRHEQGERTNQEHPPADRHAYGGQRGSEPDEQRPPAVRAEEAKLAGTLLDLALRLVFRPRRQPPAGEQQIEPGQEGQ